MTTQPLISIVTPSFNQASFLEATIVSVVNQNYPFHEHIVMDGGSTDGSLDIIKRYADGLTYWESEKDHGQSDALNKGFARATGDVLCWLNSDDTFEPGALQRVAGAAAAAPAAAVFYGDCYVIDAVGERLRTVRPATLTFEGLLRYWIEGSIPPQPAMFIRAAAWREVGPLKTDLHYSMDYDLWLALAQRHAFHYVAGPPLANYRFHPGSKTIDKWFDFEPECRRVSQAHWGPRWGLRYRRLQWERVQYELRRARSEKTPLRELLKRLRG